jgi:phage repressor protein C with HTH and peptisase S24 domain
MNLTVYAHALKAGETVKFKPRGHSMEPIIRNGQQVTVAPVDGESLQVGDVVLCKVQGHHYLHKIINVDRERRRVLIGNNKGHTNGWTGYHNVFGRVGFTSGGLQGQGGP